MPWDVVPRPPGTPSPHRPHPWTAVDDFAIVRRMGALRARLRLLSATPSAFGLAFGLLLATGCDKLPGSEEEKKEGDASAKTDDEAAKKKAEEEAKKKADDAKKADDGDAKKQAEDAAKKAAEDAAKLAEEEAKKKAEEEAKSRPVNLSSFQVKPSGVMFGGSGMLELTAWLARQFALDFQVDDFFWSALLGALVISLVNWAVATVVDDD